VRARGCPWEGGRELLLCNPYLPSARRKPAPGGEQEEVLACALPSREESEDLCLFSLVSAVEILLRY